MTIQEAVTSVFTQYAVFNGRARRSEYWYFTLFNVLVSIVLSLLANVASVFSIVSGIYSLAILIPGIAVAVRRLHDIGKSGLWFLLIFIPLVGSIILLVWFATDSQPGSNQFGPNPKEDNTYSAY